MTTGIETFIHRFTPGKAPDALTLLLLHGTGGNEDDLLELGHVLDEQAALLSPRGQVSEHGANRWFRRLAEGVFDTDDLLARTDQLAAFVTNAVEHYQLGASRLVAVGFSNGANIAATMLLRHPRLLRAAVLFAPMVPLDDPPMVDLSRVGVLIGAGTADPIAPPAQAQRLVQQFIDRGAAVALHWHPDGHGIDRPTLAQATTWLRKIHAATSPGPLP
jgi:phospholipase/carboxylesterase